ncbi:hypothetical protein [Lelliottia nimipressuralis]
MFILTQLNINQRQRLWALMDTHTRQPLLYPLLYLIDQVEISLSSAPLSTYKKPANFVEKEFDSPARREEW